MISRIIAKGFLIDALVKLSHNSLKYLVMVAINSPLNGFRDYFNGTIKWVTARDV